MTDGTGSTPTFEQSLAVIARALAGVSAAALLASKHKYVGMGTPLAHDVEVAAARLIALAAGDETDA